jgi:hypothetical protein
MKAQQNKPDLSSQAFWDVDMGKIDYEKNARFVVEKVIDRGTLKDFKNLREFYGDERMKREVINARWLGDREINFCCVIFGLNPKDFKCYIKKQSNPKLWIY